MTFEVTKGNQDLQGRGQKKRSKGKASTKTPDPHNIVISILQMGKLKVRELAVIKLIITRAEV